jgi:hypothetical protein
MDATRIASNQWKTCKIIIRCLFYVYFQWPWTLHNNLQWALSGRHLPIISRVSYDYHMFKNCLENVLVIVHVLFNLSKWPWWFWILKIDNLKYCWNSFFFFSIKKLCSEMTKIPKIDQSQITSRNYKSEINGLTRTPGNTGGGIRCLGVSIPRWPATPTVSPTSWSWMRSYPRCQIQCAKYGLIVGMKNFRQHMSQWNFIIIN